jgi:hypothetical protein
MNRKMRAMEAGANEIGVEADLWLVKCTAILVTGLQRQHNLAELAEFMYQELYC